MKTQTSVIKNLELSPLEIETIVTTVDDCKSQAKKIVKQLISSDVDIITVLHHIGNGEAVSKESGCLCIITALEKICPYQKKKQCVGCEYEIRTKSTLYLLISEYNRLCCLYEDSDNELERKKNRSLLVNTIIPKMDEILSCIRENYGEETYLQYEQLIKENTCR